MGGTHSANERSSALSTWPTNVFSFLNRSKRAGCWRVTPPPYATLSADGGAEHLLGSGLTLGSLVDADADGQPTASATGDDNDGTNDDDGVTFGTMMAGQLDASVTVNVQGGGGKLDAWLDFNGDGSWGGPGEFIFASRDVVVGDNLLQFDVPSWAESGVAYARFRLSTSGNYAPSEIASDGEVEDYQIFIASPTTASGKFASERTIFSSALASENSIYAADVDGDGDLDILSATSDDDRIAWHMNDGDQNFTTHTISTAADSPRSVVAADVDSDGDMDVLTASTQDDKIAWYENDGGQNFSEHTISTIAIGATSVFAADVDTDGDLDVLSASKFDSIKWYENDGSEGFIQHTIASTGTEFVFATDVDTDVDTDGDIDVLSARSSGSIVWYANDGGQIFSTHTITASSNSFSSVFASDMDKDGDMDVLSSSLGFSNDTIAWNILWYENDGNQEFTIRVIDAHGWRWRP